MATHNAERQAVMKRKRDEAEEEAQARIAMANERAAKQRAVQVEDVKLPSRRAQKTSRRAKPKVAARSRAHTEKQTVSQAPSSSEAPAVDTHETASLPEHERINEDDLRLRAAATEAQIEARSNAFLAILISNAASDRCLRRIEVDIRSWSEYRTMMLSAGENNIQDLDAQIAIRESEGQDILFLQQARKEKEGEVLAADRYLELMGPVLNELSKALHKRNSRIYDFADLPRGAKHLESLSDSYWELFGRCREANTRSKDLELELLELEQKQAENFEHLDEYSRRVVRKTCGADAASAASSPKLATEESAEALKDRMIALEEDSFTKAELQKSLQRARCEQSKLEAGLNRCADDLLVQRKLLHADPSSNNAVQGSRNHAENAAEDGGGEALDEENGNGVPNMISKSGPVEASQETGGEPVLARRVHESTEEDAQTPQCDRHQNAGPLTPNALLEILARARDARKRLKLCKAEFRVMREHIPHEARLLDRKIQGPIRVAYMQQKTRELIEAEDDYRNVLREAQNAHAVINERSQCSNFCDRDDETFTDGFSGWPQHKVTRADVQQWLDAITGNDQSASTPDLQHDLKMDWDRMLDLGFGEEFEYISFGREQELLNRELKFPETLRQDEPWLNAENDLHPRNRDVDIGFEVDMPPSWADVSRPMRPSKYPTPSQTAPDIPEDLANGQPHEPNPMGLDDSEKSVGNNDAHMPLYDPAAPLADYAMEGYDGVNMDGIE